MSVNGTSLECPLIWSKSCSLCWLASYNKKTTCWPYRVQMQPFMVVADSCTGFVCESRVITAFVLRNNECRDCSRLCMLYCTWREPLQLWLDLRAGGVWLLFYCLLVQNYYSSSSSSSIRSYSNIWEALWMLWIQHTVLIPIGSVLCYVLCVYS